MLVLGLALGSVEVLFLAFVAVSVSVLVLIVGFVLGFVSVLSLVFCGPFERSVRVSDGG